MKHCIPLLKLPSNCLDLSHYRTKNVCHQYFNIELYANLLAWVSFWENADNYRASSGRAISKANSLQSRSLLGIVMKSNMHWWVCFSYISAEELIVELTMLKTVRRRFSVTQHPHKLLSILMKLSFIIISSKGIVRLGQIPLGNLLFSVHLNIHKIFISGLENNILKFSVSPDCLPCV